ncbi:MAG TPA: DNA-formamidopyrimidine glycosylase family protein [Acidimicrobiales bacterium]|nr:DNA-formamidopyrimidine glycosylase family protein [Acidimicrobiales bacterium]
MPELPEIEAYRQLAEHALDRRVAAVHIGDPRFVRGDVTPQRLSAVLRGGSFQAVRRIGKLLVFDVRERDHRLGVRFGMTGRLLVDGVQGVEQLMYASNRADTAWDRFTLRFGDGGRMVVRDPRLLGGVSLDPDEGALGPDALTITLAQLRHQLAGSAAPLKARLMDQSRIAGVGNLIADETLWRAGLVPGRPAGSLSDAEVRRLHTHLRRTLGVLLRRGGSHLGDIVPQRRPGGRCPRDGTELRRSTIGGRTTWWCPRHQR